MATTVTSKGQVTIPVAVRERLGIAPGDAVMFDLDLQGRVVLSKVNGGPPKSRFAAFVGTAGPGPSTDELMAMLRGED